LMAAGADYSVTVRSQPQDQTCSVNNGSGTVGNANVAGIQVTCAITTSTIGGTITGLSAAGLVLSNGGDAISVATGSSAFVLPTKVAAGGAFAVAVQVQPTGLNCQVVNGTGTMPSSAVTDVTVQCGLWAWMSGSDAASAAGSYGTEGTAAAGNVPGARASAVSWIDAAGNLWLFGGTGTNGDFNDLWKYQPGAGTWTWVSGANTVNAAGVYGVQGVAAPGNVPGARMGASSWIDAAGNLWMFGGQGYDSAGTLGGLNDLWHYDSGHAQWSWVSGANTAWAAGTAAPAGAPGARSGAVSWLDAAGNLWLFGGMGMQGPTNDLWEFVPSTGQWTLVSGSQTANAVGIYGTQGKAAAANVPGSRAQAVAAADAAGNLWLFGGAGYGQIGMGLLNDLWKFDPATSQWTWMSGQNSVNGAGIYGTQNASAIKLPGAREAATATADAAGNLWIFGGIGYDSAGKRGSLNDMWQYNAGSGQWIWMGGSQTAGAAGVYGTQGAAAAGDGPGERCAAISWMDGAGNFWLFGGQDAAGSAGMLNDLWEFVP